MHIGSTVSYMNGKCEGDQAISEDMPILFSMEDHLKVFCFGFLINFAGRPGG